MSSGHEETYREAQELSSLKAPALQGDEFAFDPDVDELNNPDVEQLSEPPLIGMRPRPSDIFGDEAENFGRATSPKLYAQASQFPTAVQYRVWRWENGVPVALGAIDAEATEELSKDPAGQRMMPFTTRGHVSSLGTFQSPDESFPEYRGQIESEYGGAVRFAVVKDPADDELTEGSFVLLDGLFLQWVRHETADGWQDMPMLCGRGLVPSSARLTHDQDHLDEVLAQVVDGTFDSGAEITGEAKWALLAKAQDENSGVNWDEALELDSDTLTSLFQNPKMYRGRAFRLPISVNMGLDDPVYGENPLRAEVLSTGWLGNQAWTGPAPVIKWVAAMDGSHLMDRKNKAHYLVGQGFFLKNLDYENADGRPLRAPVFAMRSLEIFTPPFDGRPERIMYMV
ncbi:hypothetical protein HOH51_04470, partial [bacterium]|nr:hypothetical protein [bacterium]